MCVSIYIERCVYVRCNKQEFTSERVKLIAVTREGL